MIIDNTGKRPTGSTSSTGMSRARLHLKPVFIQKLFFCGQWFAAKSFFGVSDTHGTVEMWCIPEIYLKTVITRARCYAGKLQFCRAKRWHVYQRHLYEPIPQLWLYAPETLGITCFQFSPCWDKRKTGARTYTRTTVRRYILNGAKTNAVLL